MRFEELGIIDTTESFLNLLSHNCSVARGLRENIRRLEVEVKETKSKEKAPEATTSINETDKKTALEEELEYYAEDYKKLGDSFTKADLLGILPSLKNEHFKSIVLRLIAESVKEIKEIKELIDEEKNSIGIEEIAELNKALMIEQRKISLLKEELQVEEEMSLAEDCPVFNKIILVPTSTGNIRILDEVEHLPIEYHARVLELINSIINGTFKDVKRLVSNNVLVSMSEVRAAQTRVVFKRLNKDTYALVTAFIKKSNNDNGYQNSLKNKVIDFKYMEDLLKEKLTDQDFLNLNDLYVQELFRILEGSKRKEMKKGDRNDKRKNL